MEQAAPVTETIELDNIDVTMTTLDTSSAVTITLDVEMEPIERAEEAASSSKEDTKGALQDPDVLKTRMF